MKSAGRKGRKGPSHVTTPGTYGRNEMDSHADTSCAGKNWRLLEVSNEVCEVLPFLESYGPVQDIQVGRCGTVWTDDYGNDYLLVADQMLWFGELMENSLINPNQIRDFGIAVNDNP